MVHGTGGGEGSTAPTHGVTFLNATQFVLLIWKPQISHSVFDVLYAVMGEGTSHYVLWLVKKFSTFLHSQSLLPFPQEAATGTLLFQFTTQFSLPAFGCEGLLATTLSSNGGHCGLSLVTSFVINLIAFRTVCATVLYNCLSNTATLSARSSAAWGRTIPRKWGTKLTRTPLICM